MIYSGLESLGFQVPYYCRKAALYGRIFPALSLHEELRVYAWEVEDVHRLLGMLEHLPGLKFVIIRNNDGKFKHEVSEEAQAKLRTALRARGGDLTYAHDT